MSATYESADEAVAKGKQEEAEKYQGKVEKMMIKKQFTNKQGNLVLYSKEWYVPQLRGAVKKESCDNWGGISTIMKSADLEYFYCLAILIFLIAQQ